MPQGYIDYTHFLTEKKKWLNHKNLLFNSLHANKNK